MFTCKITQQHKGKRFFCACLFSETKSYFVSQCTTYRGEKCNTIIVIKKKWLQCFYLTDIHSVMPLKYGIQPNIFGGKSLELNETFWRKKNGTTKMWENITEGWKKQKCSWSLEFHFNSEERMTTIHSVMGQFWKTVGKYFGKMLLNFVIPPKNTDQL